MPTTHTPRLTRTVPSHSNNVMSTMLPTADCKSSTCIESKQRRGSSMSTRKYEMAVPGSPREGFDSDGFRATRTSESSGSINVRSIVQNGVEVETKY